MSRNYDNWERLLVAVLRKEQLWQLFHEDSRSPNLRSEASSSTSSNFRYLDSPLHDLSSFSSSFPYQKIVLNVAINCQKCKIQVMKAVLKLTGVDVVTMDAEKGTLTVVGIVDPVCVITNVRKTGKYAEITSMGPPKKPADPPKPKPLEPLPPCCNECQLVACLSCF